MNVGTLGGLGILLDNTDLFLITSHLDCFHSDIRLIRGSTRIYVLSNGPSMEYFHSGTTNNTIGPGYTVSFVRLSDKPTCHTLNLNLGINLTLSTIVMLVV